MEPAEVAAFYDALGLKVPLDLPDDQQTCQVKGCENHADHTLFMQHKTETDLEIRLFLCATHHDPFIRPKPIGVRLLYMQHELSSIPMDQRKAGKEKLAAQVEAYCLDNMMRPCTDITWTWSPVEFFDTLGRRIKGMELLGEVEIERVEMEAAIETA